MKGPKTEIFRKRPLLPWWFWVWAGNLFLLAVTILNPPPLPLPGKGFLTKHFNLAVEMNLAVWWSGISLFLLALLAYRLSSTQGDKTRWAWLILAAIFAGFSLDEIGSIHERIGGWGSLFLVGALPMAMAGFALLVLFRNTPSRRQAWLVFSGFLVLGTVAFQEYLEHLIDWPGWMIGIRRGLEEGTELLAIFLFFLALVGKQRPVESGFFRTLIPDPSKMKGLPAILTAGVLIHLSASLFLPGFVDVHQKGNPLIWYPLVVFFLLFAVAFWRSRLETGQARRSWLFLSFFFVLCSAGMIYRDGLLLSALDGWIAREYLVGAPGFFAVVVLSIVCFLGPRFLREMSGQILLLLGLTVVGFFLSAFGLEFLMPGVLAYLIFQLFSTCR